MNTQDTLPSDESEDSQFPIGAVVFVIVIVVLAVGVAILLTTQPVLQGIYENTSRMM